MAAWWLSWQVELCYSEENILIFTCSFWLHVTPNGLSTTKIQLVGSLVFVQGQVAWQQPQTSVFARYSLLLPCPLMFIWILTVNLAFVKCGRKWLSAINSPVEPSAQSEHPVTLVMADLLPYCSWARHSKFVPHAAPTSLKRTPVLARQHKLVLFDIIVCL